MLGRTSVDHAMAGGLVPFPQSFSAQAGSEIGTVGVIGPTLAFVVLPTRSSLCSAGIQCGALTAYRTPVPSSLRAYVFPHRGASWSQQSTFGRDSKRRYPERAYHRSIRTRAGYLLLPRLDAAHRSEAAEGL